MKSIIVSIEGNIGSGKSTLLSKLSELSLKLPCVIVLEQVDEWNKMTDDSGENIFCLFYKNPKKYSYIFQSFVLFSRVQYLLKTIKENPEDTIIICERSHYTDIMVFAKTLYELKDIEDIEWKVYQKWHDMINELFIINISGIVYVQTSPEISLNRILKRSRNGESDIKLEYLTIIHNKHEDWLNSTLNIPLHTINGNIDINDRDTQLTDIVSFINNL